MTVAAPARARRSLDAYLQPKTLQMLVLGFSSGLPFLLVGATLGYWLREAGATLTLIGYASGVGLAYSFKFLWAPIIDRTNAPLFGFLGRRRGWIALAQVVVGLGLIAMAAAGPVGGLGALVALSALVALASATQDIVIDAWRIESAANADELGLLTSAATFGYRIAILATDAIILILADWLGWSLSYGIFGALMAIGLAVTFLAPEPARADRALDIKQRELPLTSWRGLYDAVAGPFIEFFRAHGVLALLMLTAIALYRLPDFLMGPMANPFYHDLGLTKTLVGEVRGSIGLVASLAGIAAGGFCALRFGSMRALIIGGILQGLSIAAFSLLAYWGTDIRLFMGVMAGDSFGTSFAGIALVTYMSSLTSIGYTATQYALLSSAYTLVGKSFKTLSGLIIEGLKGSMGLMQAYGAFFIACGLIGIPAIILFVLLIRAHNRREPAQVP